MFRSLASLGGDDAFDGGSFKKLKVSEFIKFKSNEEKKDIEKGMEFLIVCKTTDGKQLDPVGVAQSLTVSEVYKHLSLLYGTGGLFAQNNLESCFLRMSSNESISNYLSSGLVFLAGYKPELLLAIFSHEIETFSKNVKFGDTFNTIMEEYRELTKDKLLQRKGIFKRMIQLTGKEFICEDTPVHPDERIEKDEVLVFQTL